jgi:tRNA threonylcarbamoyladenosine biosynthesis protein TsaE
LGEAVARILRPGDAVCLWGELGTGKSTLARALIRALTTAEEEVPSPTFTLVQTYEAIAFPIAHFDLYRLADAEEAFELGIDEALDEGAVVIEWPERLSGRLPQNRLDIEIEMDGEARRARVLPRGDFEGRRLEF